MRRMLVLAMLVGLAACSSDDPGTITVDAPGSNGPDEATCLVKRDYGNLGTLTGATGAGMSPTSLSVTLEAGPPRDTFFINLKNGIGTGTHEITGANASADTCNACVNLIADIVAMQGPTKFYFATAGTVTLTATQPPAGTITNATFVETSVNGAPTGSGCASAIDSLTFGP